jgi:hypothetical protein
MIVGFSKHGTGGGAGPVDYVTDRKREGREEFEPVTVRGDAEQTKQLIDSLDFKWKYTSGVLSFAPDEVITSEMESDIIDRFESVAFAGLENDQYNILWVRHSHAGHHELHFVTPRVELATGKSLNIKPPGERAREHFDDYRSEMNAKYGLADPTDPDRTRNVSTPDHELKIAAEALRKGEKAPDNMRELIDRVLTQRASQGLIQSRSDVLEHVSQLGLGITRTGKNYITVSDPQSASRWRLKGGLYAKDFEPSTAIERADIARERDYSKPDQAAAKGYAERVKRHISARAKYHASRYQAPEQESRLEISIEQSHLAIDHRDKSLDRYIRGELGNDAISNIEDISKLCSNNGTEQEIEKVGTLQRRSVKQGQDKLYGSTQRSEDHRHIQFNGKQSRNNMGTIDDDRARNPLIERVEEFRRAIQQATELIRSRARGITQDVRTYISRERESQSSSNKLEQASRGIEQSIDQVSNSFQKVIKNERKAQRSGPSLGR